MNHISIKKIQPASSQNKSTTINLKNMANDRALTTRSKMAAALRKSRALSTPLSPFRCRPQKKKKNPTKPRDPSHDFFSPRSAPLIAIVNYLETGKIRGKDARRLFRAIGR